jgi:hypothetical protein
MWAREQDCTWDVSTCDAAAEGGHLEVLQWAREHNCEWTMYTCAYAAESGHLEVMQWAREHGAPWNVAYVRARAAVGGHRDELAMWLAEHDDH